MKKALLNILALAAAAACTSAHAQSSVTLYGTVDAGLDYVSNQKSSTGHGTTWGMQSGNVSTSRWGLRGTEDLGGGLKAIFDLENGFSVVNGKGSNGGYMFGRQAWVGLGSDQYGTLTLGRQYDALVDMIAPMSATGSGFGGNIAMHPFDNDNLNNDVRMNNAVKFRSATYAGFQVEGAYAFSNQGGGFSNNNAYTMGASWNGGPINLAVAYFQGNEPGSTTNGALSAGSGTDNDPMFVAARTRTLGAGGSYTIGPAKVGLVFTRTMVDEPTQIAQGGSLNAFDADYLTFNNFEVNGRYALTPQLSLGGAYTYTDGSVSRVEGNASPHWNQFMLQADYALSRRTDVYLEGVYQRVSGAQGIPVLGNASIYNLAASSSNTQAVVAAGMRLKF
ncbi:Outer membrane porin protein [Paraburkholderia hiiakae]|uniref:Outer membrane porin protein n=1 Tax=Paraburkholderia hiiakae TaxID=1081782 RepID=A0ABM8NLD8_9BURK|nr:porin [Paraburkholderia hiiakae]CAD6531423.1 Outer membrane porin protein [Paraburkholderia hiiakae]